MASTRLAKTSGFQFGFSITLIVCLLLSPLGWLYYFPFLLIPFLVACCGLAQRKVNLLIYFLLLVVFLLPFFALIQSQNSFLLLVKIVALPLSLIVLLVVNILTYYRQETAAIWLRPQLKGVILICLLAVVVSVVLFYYQVGVTYLFSPKALVLQLSQLQNHWFIAN